MENTTNDATNIGQYGASIRNVVNKADNCLHFYSIRGSWGQKWGGAGNFYL